MTKRREDWEFGTCDVHGEIRVDHRGRCLECKNEAQREWVAERLKEDPGYMQRAVNDSNRALLLEFFREYGATCVGTRDGEPCQWSVADPRALTVGHMRGDGAAQRAKINGARVLRDLRKRNWPRDEGIATQCACCQLIDARALHDDAPRTLQWDGTRSA